MATASERVDPEYIFARDMVNVLVRLKLKDFQLENDRHDLPTPFCFRIRRAVEHFVTREDVNIYFAFTDYQTKLHDFKSLVAYQRRMIVPMIGDLVALLKHFSLLCVMAAWYKKWDDLIPQTDPTKERENAPAVAVEEIRQVLIGMVGKYETPELFWRSLRIAAPYLTNRPLTAAEKAFISKS